MTVEEVFPAAPLDPGARLLTAVAGVVAIGGAVALALARPGGLTILVGAPSLFVLLVALPLAFAPTGYAVGRGELAVLRRGAAPLLFPLGGLAAARPTAMPRSVRLLGSGGLFGWWGRFANRGWGRFRAYATDRRRGVLLEWPGFKLFVSPENPEALCRAVLARRRGAERRGRRS
ncbi:MAG TPA: PH domain-containing protein [Actinomycetota bacterium]|nr:PH domain-containing protein [Actinomycetota bacterium]